MAEPKTKMNEASVEQFLNAIADEERRADCRTVAQLMEAATGAPPKMWGANIIGFGVQPYKYANGREGDWPIVAFSPRKKDLTLYVLAYGDDEKEETLLKKLGKHKRGKSCLYLNRLADIDLPTLKQLLANAAKRSAIQ